MFKKIIIMALCMLPLAASAQSKFGYFNYDDMLKAMPEYTEAQNNLNMLKDNYESELKRSEDEFNKKYTEFLDGQKEFPKSILMKRQKELQNLMDQTLEFKKDVKEMLSKAEKNLMAPVKQKLDEAVAAVAQEKALDYVINTAGNNYFSKYICPEFFRSKTELNNNPYKGDTIMGSPFLFPCRLWHNHHSQKIPDR